MTYPEDIMKAAVVAYNNAADAPHDDAGAPYQIIAAALLAERKAKVKVKPLEWAEHPIPPSGECLASSVVGLYCIPLGRRAFSLRFRDTGEDGPYETIDDAKAAAQADYERRILSAIMGGGDE